MLDSIERETSTLDVPPAWIVGARSMLVDRVVPQCEFLWMPQIEQKGGQIALHRDTAGHAPERKLGWRAHAHRLVRKDRGVGRVDGPIVDLRLNFPENWAHAQIFHLPLAAMAQAWLQATPTLLVTFATPGFVKALLRHFGFPVIATERAVAGDIVTPVLSGVDAVRPARRALCAPLIAALDAKRVAGDLPKGLPTKIFVVRRKTRRIENEAEIEAYLAQQGFVKLYPETLSVPEQIELFNGATEIVAIHGAALAPLLFRSPDAPPYSLVEILSPGHMANSYRLMACQTGGRYVGVRGRVKPEHVARAYQFDRFYWQHSLGDFYVDVQSVKAAQQILIDGTAPQTFG